MKPKNCPITNDFNSKLIFSYNSPPEKEMSLKLKKNEIYKREVWQFLPSCHFINVHSMNLEGFYEGDYVDSTYKNLESMIKTFNKIISLPANKSDNIGRFNAIDFYAKKWFNKIKKRRLLDIGSGLGVFPYVVNKNGWECTSIDPDPRSIYHIENNIKVKVLCGDFMQLKPNGVYNIVTLNKVLEHVEDPIKMLSSVEGWLSKDGFVYIEIPDGEYASKEGKDREEFFVEHLHIFSIASTCIMATRAGFKVQHIYRLQEPSSKYTIRAFLSK